MSLRIETGDPVFAANMERREAERKSGGVRV
jgi:hypothetical protein